MNFLVHGFNSIMSIGDILVSGRPCRLMHFYQPFVVLLAYIAFSSIYWAAGGLNANGDSYIYPVEHLFKLMYAFEIEILFS